MKRVILIGVIVSLGLVLPACGSTSPVAAVPPIVPTVLQKPSATSTPVLPIEHTPTASRTLHPASTATPDPSLTYTPSPSATPLPTATWVFHPAGDIIAPILLYHHVADSPQGNRYYINVASFRHQMETLKKLGYTGITVSSLADAITAGGNLPARPVVITFDDGNADIYQNAYPVMKELGFVGTFYIVVGVVDTYHIVTTNQLKAMIADGWEVGSHSMSHADVRNPPNGLRWEAYTSRVELEKKVGGAVKTFAYPFGLSDTFVAKKIKDYGYTSAVGLGVSTHHGLIDLYSLTREEVESSFDLEAFGKLLPWTDIPVSLFP